MAALEPGCGDVVLQQHFSCPWLPTWLVCCTLFKLEQQNVTRSSTTVTSTRWDAHARCNNDCCHSSAGEKQCRIARDAGCGDSDTVFGRVTSCSALRCYSLFDVRVDGVDFHATMVAATRVGHRRKEIPRRLQRGKGQRADAREHVEEGALMYLPQEYVS